MTLSETRHVIDGIDDQIRELMMKRLDCSEEVAHSKIESGELTIFRPDREEAMLLRLGEGVPDDRKAGYLAVVRKITETSRMYQYGLIFDSIEGLFAPLAKDLNIKPNCSRVRVRLTRDNRPNAMSSILSMIGDYGFNMDRMELISQNDEHVTFELLIIGDLNTKKMQKLMFQLSQESQDFWIMHCY